MGQKDFVDRRKEPRFGASAIASLDSVHLVEETEIKLINISRGGALIETKERMSPGNRVSLRIVTAETAYLLKGRIIRSSVYTIGKALTYQCSMVFDEDFAILPPGEDVE
jgi:hypothetical protein